MCKCVGYSSSISALHFIQIYFTRPVLVIVFRPPISTKLDRNKIDSFKGKIWKKKLIK